MHAIVLLLLTIVSIVLPMILEWRKAKRLEALAAAGSEEKNT